MTNDEYRDFVLSITAPPELTNQPPSKLQHAVYGLVTESGELMDALKRATFYGLPLDYENLLEEAGDIRFYYTLLLSALGVDDEEIVEMNVSKLKKRYPDGFTSEDAEARKDKQDADS